MDPATGDISKKPIDEFVKEWTGILILLVPNESFTSGIHKISMYKRFAFLLKPHKKIVVQSIFGALTYTILGLATSIYVQKIIDYVIPDGNKNLINLLSVAMIILLFFSLFINYMKSVFMMRTGLQIDARLILGYYKHLLRLPQSFFDNMRSGEVISRINDAVKIRSFINETLVTLAVNIFTVLFAFGLMFTYYWKLAVVILIIIPLYMIVYFIYNKVNKTVQRRVMEDAAELQAQLVESINTAGTIKKFNLEEYEDVKTENRFIQFIKTGYRSAINGLVAGTSSDFIAKLFTIILLWVGTYFVIDNTITSGELMSFYALTGYFIGPVSSLVGINKLFQDAKIAADRLFEILDLDVESVENKIRLNQKQTGDIVFENVSFRYGTRADVLKDFNIKFEQGKISAIVGESGSGKTTIASLMQNLYSLQEGRISLNDIDIKHIDNNCLRSMVCVVPQKIDLFEGSVMDNIALDDYSPDNEKIISICKDVGILDFVERLPNGFDTNIGENGMQLSGGQRQRLAIARALYRDPSILILDEATSALDSESELHIKNIVNKLKKDGKTIILIAHRLGTVMNSDKIFVLENGQLIEEGTHKELLAKDGRYVSFWKSQTQL